LASDSHPSSKDGVSMTELFYLDPNTSGAPSVLLLHGLGSNGFSWNSQFAPLSEAGFRPLAPDLPGFGASRYDGRGWNFKRVAADLANLLRELGTGPVHVVGGSMGGVIAQQFVLDYPELVRKLALVSTFAAQPFLARLIMVSIMGLPPQPKYAAQHTFPKPDQEAQRQKLIEDMTRSDPHAYSAAILNLGLFNSVSRLGEIKAPTLVMTGDQDTINDPLRQKILVQRIPGAKQVIFPNMGHAVAEDAPKAFNRTLLEFLLA
jgi:3-oxoadipate enol-lactonase